jgi:hypothetical protein
MSHFDSSHQSLPDDLVPFPEFARELGFHVGSLHRHRLAKRDPMPCWRVLGGWNVSRSEFVEWTLRRSSRPTTSKLDSPRKLTAEQRKRAERAVAECAAMKP